jgi:ectoine hydroxylase-related dioxygenase (phytanoyl-CoA dioxygenase family)
MPTTADLHFYETNGYLLVKGLFSAEEAAQYREHYTALREAGSCPLDDVKPDMTSADPLRRYPRMMQMHRWDETSLRWLTEPRLNTVLTALLGREPYAVQTMLYFKPPQARGQALHQDNFYLRAQPGSCIAAWMALETVDEANGCLQVVPGSHTWEILCTEQADMTTSFSEHTVPLPAGAEPRSVLMDPGDVLFFHGALVHGSPPNTTTDRFRRSLIGHYVEGQAEQVGQWYHPVLRMDGSAIDLAFSPNSSQCGVWVESPSGAPAITLVATDADRKAHE